MSRGASASVGAVESSAGRAVGAGAGAAVGGRVSGGVAAGRGTYLSKPENVSRIKQIILDANKLTEGKGELMGLGISMESAINTATYYSHTVEQGASIFRSIAQGHMFKNGNNRTAVTFWQSFARLNTLSCTLNERQLLDIAYKVSEGKFPDTVAIAKVLLK